MRKAIVMILLAVVSSNAAAEWIEVGEGNNTFAYADAKTIRRTGDMVTMWSLLDYKTVQRPDALKPFMSMKRQDEYDCKEERERGPAVSFHSGRMGVGELVGSSSDLRKWESIPSGTAPEALWKFACAKW